MVSKARSMSKEKQCLLIICGILFLGTLVFQDTVKHASTKVTSSSAVLFGSKCDAIDRGVPTFMTRDKLGEILNAEGHTIGVELGVQKGLYSKTLLSKWHSVQEYHLVDVWAPQENYKDGANLAQDGQDRNYDQTMSNVAKWKDKIRVCRDFTSECVKKYPENYFDFVYVDARHDFKGAYLDMTQWWPKLKKGGIMAGHDYVTQSELTTSDWTVNFDGTIDETGTVVKGAVDKFAAEVCRQVTVAYRENAWNTWAMRK